MSVESHTYYIYNKSTENELILKDFEWDERKNEANRLRHRLDFRNAVLVFEDIGRLRWLDNRKNYGEIRYQTIGRVLNNVLFVVYTIRNGNIRIISARKADKKERSLYDNKKNN